MAEKISNLRKNFDWYYANLRRLLPRYRGRVIAFADGNVIGAYDSDAAEMYFDVLKKQVSQFKNSEEGRHVMCKAMERIAERNRAEGKAEGKRETMLAMAKRMLKDGVLALKDVARYTGLSLAQVKKLQASMA